MRPLLVLLALLVALLAFDRVRRVRSPAAATRTAVIPDRKATPSTPATGAPTTTPPPESRTTASDLIARLETRRRLSAAAGTTYFDSLFAQTDSVLRRWPDREGRPFLVAIASDSSAKWTAMLIAAMDRAVASWQEVLPALRFSFTADSMQANVVVRAADRLGENRTGQTDVQWSQDGAIQSARITLAFFTPAGRPMPDAALRAVAVHELGHALGLGHSPILTDVMYSATATTVISPRDRATMSLLYQLPLGSVRASLPK